MRYSDAAMSPTKKRRIGGSAPIESLANGGSSDGGSPKVQVVVPSPSESPGQLPTPVASSQVEMEKETGNYTLIMYLAGFV